MIEIIRGNEQVFEEFWNTLMLKDDLEHPFGLRSYRKYDTAYAGKGGDRHMILLNDDKPVAGFYVPSHNPILTLGELKTNQFQRIFKDEVEDLLEHSNRLEFDDLLTGGRLSYLGEILIQKGAQCHAVWSQIIDLSKPKEELWSNIRKSYKSKINQGLKNRVTHIITHQNITDETMGDFQKLHAKAAGRITRPQESWDIQLKMIREGESYLIMSDNGNEFYSGALFMHSKKTAYYAVAASDPDLEDDSHAILWEGILHARRLGLKYFEVGNWNYPGQFYPVSDKQLNISTFKKGFGGTFKQRVRIVWEKK